MYDDGGFSGGTMERPALQRLLADIEAGKIDVVVVYKVDRLTRSLADFAKIVEVFDAHGVSFVSVTQQFNTTTSMGRLTLNVLLSFAQFEREVTGERIRDKIAASKKKGMWMGGLPPLGYDVAGPQARRQSRRRPRRFATSSALRRARLGARSQAELEARDRQQAADDRGRAPHGGQPLARGALYLMLQNRIYRGEIMHKGEPIPESTRPSSTKALWEKVQAVLAENRVERATGSDAK